MRVVNLPTISVSSDKESMKGVRHTTINRHPKINPGDGIISKVGHQKRLNAGSNEANERGHYVRVKMRGHFPMHYG